MSAEAFEMHGGRNAAGFQAGIAQPPEHVVVVQPGVARLPESGGPTQIAVGTHNGVDTVSADAGGLDELTLRDVVAPGLADQRLEAPDEAFGGMDGTAHGHGILLARGGG